MKLSKKGLEKLQNALDYIERANNFIMDNSTHICIDSTLSSKGDHDYFNSNNKKIVSINKKAGSKYNTLEDGIGILKSIIKNGEL